MKKLSTFNDINDRTLRAWNRFAVFFNTLGNVGVEPALNYFRQFDEESKADLRKMKKDLENLGYEGVKAAIHRGDYSVV